MFKKILIFIIIGIFISSISGCKESGEELQIPQEGAYTTYTKVEEKIPYNIADDVVLEYYDENTLFENANLIFKGIVINEAEISIEEYIGGEHVRTYYRDIFTFEIEKIYYSEDPSLEVGDLVKVSNASCSYWWVEGTLKMEKDKEYIVLTIKKFDTSTVEFTQYYDYYTADHWVSIIRVENGNYFVDEELTSLISGAMEQIIREDGDFKTTLFVKGEEFEGELENLITQKKG